MNNDTSKSRRVIPKSKSVLQKNSTISMPPLNNKDLIRETSKGDTADNQYGMKNFASIKS